MIEIITGNNLDVLRTMEDNSVDSIITDPPYGLSKEPDALEMLRDWLDTGHHDKKGSGFMGKSWDGFVPQPIFWAECLRVLKPGGHLASFGGTRTFDLIALGLRIAGFEFRQTVAWVYAQGFPKSLDISKSIDKQFGAEREVIGRKMFADGTQQRATARAGIYSDQKGQAIDTAPSSPEAKRYDGYGTDTKPAYEPILIFRKPISEKNIAQNVLRWGTGGLNLKACRVGTEESTIRNNTAVNSFMIGLDQKGETFQTGSSDGRFPPNFILDSHTAKLLDEQSGCLTSGAGVKTMAGHNGGGRVALNDFNRSYSSDGVGGDSGGASRFFPIIDFDVEIDTPFFYEGKAQTKERNAGVRGEKKNNMRVNAPRESEEQKTATLVGNFHPTVKPVNLMQWIVKLLTPEGGTVLEPFLGSGTTAVACKMLGFDCIGIELNEEYSEIARKRVDAVPESLFDEPKKKLRKQAEQIAIQS